MNQDQLLGWSGQISFCLASLGSAEIIQSEVDMPYQSLTQSLGVVLEGTRVLSWILYQLNGPLADFHKVCYIVHQALWYG